MRLHLGITRHTISLRGIFVTILFATCEALTVRDMESRNKQLSRSHFPYNTFLSHGMVPLLSH